MKSATRSGISSKTKAEGTTLPSSKGLSTAQAELSRQKHGSNVLKVKKPKSFIRRFFENLGDPVIRILLLALAVDLIFVFRGGSIAETVGIAVSVFLAAFISALSEHGGENAFRRLSAECGRQEHRVFRNGALVTLPLEELTVGDIIVIGAGEKLPADGYILSGTLTVDQAAITGESKEVSKLPSGERKPTPEGKSTVLRGCTVLSGEAEIEIFAVGDSTFLGRISLEVQTDTRDSPLKLRLSKLAKQISCLGYVAAALVALAFLFNCLVIDSGFKGEVILMKLSDLPFLLEKLLHAFMLGLTVIVVAVPEGLPMMIAVVLSSNIRRMVRDNVLVRKPVGIEAAGSMNLLFTDKTGTLTEGRMSLEAILLPDSRALSSVTSLQGSAPLTFRYLAESCLLNTSSSLSGGCAAGGNSTDRALLEAFAQRQPPSLPKVTARLPFDSAVKLSAASVSFGGERYTLVKGAPEKLLPKIGSYVTPDGREQSFAPLQSAFRQTLGSLSRDGKRVLIVALAQRLPSPSSIPPLTLICAVALSDPPRPQAKASVRALQEAGIGVIMITGDSKETAASIGERCGIVGGERRLVLDGGELAAMTDRQVAEALPRIAVISRALPTDKSRLFRIAQELDLVVGMTGDGINDAPALKAADVGFAMGSGTEVAKDAGDVIILDNDLSSIVNAVLYGRSIFKSIRKFITLQLTMNFCAVGVSMICPFIGIEAPVTVVQMLWINIIMDTLGGLAFAGEAPSPLCMKEPPKRRGEPILNGYMINQIAVLGGSTVALCLFFLLSPSVSSHFRYAPDGIYLLTAFFALFIFTSVFNCFNCRSDRLKMLSGLSKNPTFILIMGLILAVQIGFIYLGGSVLRTAPLTPSELSYTLLLSLAVFPAELLRRLLWRLLGRKQGF